MSKKINPQNYEWFLREMLSLIQKAQLEAYRKVNKVLIEFYWMVGQKIVEALEKFKWGRRVVRTLSKDLQQSFPGIRGFSERNLWNMRNFFLAYHQNPRIEPLLEEIGWSHHVIILDKIKDPLAREYYMRATRKYGWTARVLMHKIDLQDFERFAISDSQNFDKTLPEHIQQQAKLAIKDSYIFDFLEMGEEHTEWELEEELVHHIQDFILELGLGEFTFVGRQFRITVDEEDYFIDLLFYHRTLQSLIAIELKVDKFKPEYAGKLNFYLAALDKQVRKSHENPSIGIVLCREQNKTTVEYAFSDIRKPMGVSTYLLKKSLPKEYWGLLPTPQALKKKVEEWDKKREERQKWQEKKILERMGSIEPLKTPAKSALLISPKPKSKKGRVALRSSSCKRWAGQFFKNLKKEKSRKIRPKPNELLFLGKLYKVMVHIDKKKSSVLQRQKELHVNLFRRGRDRVLEDWLREKGTPVLEAKARHFIQLMDLSEVSFSIRSKKNIWPGLEKGTLSLNWRIVQAPKDVMDYLIVHGLIHCFEKSHSKAFWWRLSQFCPNFVRSHQWLSANHKLIGRI